MTGGRIDDALAHIEREYLTWAENGELAGRTIVRYRPDGRETARLGFDGAGRELFHEDVIYTENTCGREVLSLTYNSDGILFQKKLAKFNRNEELVEMIYLDCSGKIIDHQIYTYTDDVVSYAHLNDVGELVESWQRGMSGESSKEQTA